MDPMISAEGAKALREAREERERKFNEELLTNPCGGCEKSVATRLLDHEPLCGSCVIDRLIEVVERLSTMYVTCNAEVRYDYED